MIPIVPFVAQRQVGPSLDSTHRVAPLLTPQMAKVVSENFPRRGKEAGDALRRYFAEQVSPAEQAQLTEHQVMRMLDDEK